MKGEGQAHAVSVAAMVTPVGTPERADAYESPPCHYVVAIKYVSKPI